jgi:glucose-6-phosphate 1-epimerase
MVEGAAPAASPLPLVSPVALGAASGAPVVESRLFRGLPCLHLRWPGGDAATVALRGAQVLSWVCGGRERLYLSPKALFDGESAIRGGVPVCFPQFNQRGSLPKHGFARNLTWTALPAADGVPDGINDAAAGCRAAASRLPFACATAKPPAPSGPGLRGPADGATGDRQPADHAPGPQHRCPAAALHGALHTYLAVDDIAAARLDGLSGQAGWDALTNQTAPAAAEHPL